MKQLSLYEQFEVQVYELDEWKFQPHTQSLFETIFIMKGYGTFLINQESIGYDAGSIFLLTPGDTYSFRVGIPTKFCIITFSETLISGKSRNENQQSDLTGIFRQVEMTFYLLGKKQEAMINSPAELNLIRLIIDQLVSELNNKDIFSANIMSALLFLVLNITARNLQSKLISSSGTRSNRILVSGIINYIQENIGNNKKLNIGRMSRHFGKSQSALHDNFKKATRTTIWDFIIETRLQMAASRLLYTRMTASEIADNFGYHDESHLNKSFREKFGVSPTMYRQKERMKLQ